MTHKIAISSKFIILMFTHGLCHKNQIGREEVSKLSTGFKVLQNREEKGFLSQ